MKTTARKVTLVLVALLLAYVAYGYVANNFYSDIRRERARRATEAQERSEPVKIGVLWGAGGDDSFLRGAELAAQQANSSGLKFRDGKERQFVLRSVRFPSTDRLESSDFVSMVTRDSDMVAVVGEFTERQDDQTSVLCEYQGLAMVASTVTHAEAVSAGFGFTLETKPGLSTYARTLARQLHRVVPSEKEILKVGIFFEGTAPQGQRLAGTILEEIQEQNDLVRAASEIQAAIADRNLNPDIQLLELRSNAYLQAGITRDPTAISNFAQYCIDDAGLDSENLTVGQALAQSALPKKQLEVAFVQAYSPADRGGEDYRSLIARCGALDSDAIVLMSELPSNFQLIKTLRQLRARAQLVSMDTMDPVMLSNALGADGDGLVMMTVDNPQSTDPSFVSFAEAYRQAVGREANEQGLLGYQSVQLVAEACRREGSSIPMDIINSIKHSAEPFISAGTTMIFDEGGWPVRRPISFVRYNNATLRVIDLKGADNVVRASQP